MGIEPTTSRLEVLRATNCAKRAIPILNIKINYLNKSQITHKISQTGFEPVTDGGLKMPTTIHCSTTELSRDLWVIVKNDNTLPTGIEPVTSRLTVECSNQLS